MAKRFNPFERDPAILALPSGDYQVAEATRGILRRVAVLQDEIQQLDEAADQDAVVALFAQMIEVALVDGEGAAAEIVKAWEANDISLPALVRTAEFIGEELRGSAQPDLL